MKRTHVSLAGLLALSASIAAVAGAQAAGVRAHSSRAAKVSLRHTAKGTILVSSSGRTLYEFTRDHSRQDNCIKIKECSGTWPALQSSGSPLAGSGVQASLLSTISLPGGRKQVTYAGHALYLYSADEGPGETSYVGEKQFGGVWYAINAAGHAVK
jgi:predicted lipoprotein with Yx(FWY)xxD motif